MSNSLKSSDGNNSVSTYLYYSFYDVNFYSISRVGGISSDTTSIFSRLKLFFYGVSV